ncbi:carbon-nitrogen family hydrolase [Dermatophilaceae bacterium Soc4.6]
MKIALVQLAYGDDESVVDRVARAADLVRAQRGHDLVVLPELWAAGGFSYRLWADRAEDLAGAVAAAMSAAARDAGVTLLAGSIVERGSEVGAEGKDLWNTQLLFGADGELLTRYRKIHRFGFQGGEPALMEAGDELVLVDLPDGTTGLDGTPGTPGTVRAGLTTCYDLRFPELYRALLDGGARMFVVPAAWPMRRVEHWTLLARARAIEDQCFVVACNTAGTHARTLMGGHSIVVAPTGDVLAEAGADEQVLSVEVDLDLVTTWREEFPVLGDRRLPQGLC